MATPSSNTHEVRSSYRKIATVLPLHVPMLGGGSVGEGRNFDFGVPRDCFVVVSEIRIFDLYLRPSPCSDKDLTTHPRTLKIAWYDALLDT